MITSKEPGAEDGNMETLHDAVNIGDISAVKQLIQNGADVNALDQQGVPPLQFAAGRGFLEIARLLISEGADVNYRILDGGTPLMGAAACLSPDLVDLLLSNGADPNKKGIDGRFPLICTFQRDVAAIERQSECIRLLIAAGAKINQQTDYGSTPLMTAAWCGNTQGAEALLKLGAAPAMQDNRCRTAAMLAAERGYGDLAKLLKEAADTNR